MFETSTLPITSIFEPAEGQDSARDIKKGMNEFTLGTALKAVINRFYTQTERIKPSDTGLSDLLAFTTEIYREKMLQHLVETKKITVGDIDFIEQLTEAICASEPKPVWYPLFNKELTEAKKKLPQTKG